MDKKQWFALSIGNSRLHWAMFEYDTLLKTWNTEHLVEIPEWNVASELWIASVVPEQSQFWKTYMNVQWIELQRVPLQAVYPTLGVDRALALWGAIALYGSPALVIDCGTAMTFTGSADQQLVGGAILPGLRLQFEALGQSTAALPLLETNKISQLPKRWARSTDEAIQSGILHTVLSGITAFIQDWQFRYPGSAIVLTGGDANLIYKFLGNQIATVIVDPNLIFWGVCAIRNATSHGRFCH